MLRNPAATSAPHIIIRVSRNQHLWSSISYLFDLQVDHLGMRHLNLLQLFILSHDNIAPFPSCLSQLLKLHFLHSNLSVQAQERAIVGHELP